MHSSRSKLGSKRQLPNGRWCAEICAGYRVDGKRRRVSKTFASEKEADAWIEQMSAEMGRRPDLAAGVTLSHLWELYKRDKGARLAKGTLATYEHMMERRWLHTIGELDVSTITHADIQRELLSMPTSSEATHAKSVLSSVMTYGMSCGALSANVCRERYEMPGDTGSAWDDESMWDADPFAAIEGGRDVWSASVVLAALPLMEGLPLEPVWLAMVGGGLRMEEAFALRPMDIRRVKIAGRMVTQVAVHHAVTDADGRKRTKTKQSVRIVAVMDPFGERLWELARDMEPKSLVCSCDPGNQNKRWRGYFTPLPNPDSEDADERRRARNVPKDTSWIYRGRLAGLPYIPLSRMRATHETLMQEAGVMDSLNAAAHGHSQSVSYAHYQRGDTTQAAIQTAEHLRLIS